MECPQCKCDIREGTKFCENCGARVELQCPQCGARILLGKRFCGECGHASPTQSAPYPEELSFDEKIKKIQRYLPKGLAEKILSQKDKIEGERKQVTIMFCDMKGFTPLTEQLGAEKTFELMDEVYEILIHKIHEYEGTVNELRGDGVLAIFGSPIALEDAPQRALQSAIAIHEGIATLNEKVGAEGNVPPILMRIGINTGPVVIGTLGNDLRVHFTAVGDTINMASRMESLAEPGTTYVTENTFRATNHSFEFEALGKKQVKGKAEAIPVYRVLSAKEGAYRSRPGSERFIHSKMVGRDKELNKLELQVMKAINGEGSIVNIVGEAGIGKSRLVAELKESPVMTRVNLIEGRAVSIGRNLSFHPIIDLLKQWAQIRPGDGEGLAFGKLESAVRHLDPEGVNESLPFVATLMGMKLTGGYAERVQGIEGEPLEKLIFKNIRDLLTKAAEMNPLVLVLEDLHWADTSSILLMQSLFRLAETQRILFINVLRRGYQETGDRILEPIQKRVTAQYVEIRLEPLNESMSETLISSMLNIGEIHNATIRHIVQRTGGNPFFMEEVVRSLIDEHALIVEDGGFKVTEKLGNMTIPNTINGVLMARIDRLDEDTRNLIKIASVIGRNFFFRILSDVAGDVKDMEARLSHLKELQLVLERKRMDETEYFFKHALAQEAAYDSILPAKRKEIHLKVAGAIEKVFAERIHEFYGMLAYHYSRAENLIKTDEYLLKAGEEALRSSASNEALHYYREALTLYLKMHGERKDPEKVAMLHKNIAIALYNRGHYEDAVEYFDKSLDYYWGKRPGNSMSAAIESMSGFFHFLFSLYLPFLKFRKAPTEREREAIALFFKKLKALAIVNPMKYFMESFHFYRRYTSFQLESLESGIGMFVAASALFSFSGLSFKLSRRILDATKKKVKRSEVKEYIICEIMQTIANYFQGNWREIGSYDDDLVAKNLAIGEIYEATQHAYWHGLVSLYMGSMTAARRMVDKLAEIVETYENEFSQILKFELNTAYLIERRDLDGALSEAEKAIDFAQKAGFGVYLFDLCSYKAWIHILMEDIEEAEKCLESATQLKKEVEVVPIGLSNFLRSQAECDIRNLKRHLEAGQKSGTHELEKKAIRSIDMLRKISKKAAEHHTDAHRQRGLYYWLTQRQNKALRSWRKAIEIGKLLGANLELSRTYFEVGRHLNEPGSKHRMLDGVGADKYLEKARVLFEEMHLEWDLDRMGRMKGME